MTSTLPPSAAPPEEIGVQVLVRGWLSANNMVFRDGETGASVVDTGYFSHADQTLALIEQALRGATLTQVINTHLHSDHLSALPQLSGVTEVWVHEDEIDTPHAHRQRGILDEAPIRVMTGDAGEIRPGLTWIHTPGHAPGHIAAIVECIDGRVVIAGDTLGPDPAWFDDMNPPEGLDEREDHLRAFEAIRALAPAMVVPGHNPPFRLP